MKGLGAVLFLLAACGCRLSYAQVGQPENQACDAYMQQTLIRYVNENKLVKGFDESVQSVCRPWLYDTRLMLVAAVADEGVQYEKSLVLALVDPRREKVLSFFVDKIPEDATLTVGGAQIDGAKYRLAKDAQGFAVDVYNSRPQGSCVDGGFDRPRTLYIREGATFRPVLPGLWMDHWTFVKGGPSCMRDEPEVIIERWTTTIEVLKTTTKGYADLLLKEWSWQNDYERPPHDKLKLKSKRVVRYDGKQYGI